MSDVRLRELERMWKTTGSLSDEVAWLKERRRLTGGTRLRPVVRIDSQAKRAQFKVAYVSPTDALRCPATHAVTLLWNALQSRASDELIAISAEGERTLTFEAALPGLDLGDTRAEVRIYCVAGQVQDREARRQIIRGVAGVVFVPSLVDGYATHTYESAVHLMEDLRAEGADPRSTPMVLQWLPGDSRPEVGPDCLLEGLDLPILGAFSTDRETGSGIEKALFELLGHARAAHLELHGCP